MHAKKSLGQNFLNSKAVARDITRAAELTNSESQDSKSADFTAWPQTLRHKHRQAHALGADSQTQPWPQTIGRKLSQKDTVLEIGPGKGFLTAELLASGARVVAVEKDDRMIPLLTEKFAEEIKKKQFVLVRGDILEVTAGQGPALAQILKAEPWPLYKLVANIPYYLTGQIIRTFLEAKNKPERMILMVQKEVATRIVARDKKESILSIAVKVYGTPKLIKKVPARYFTPKPKVDSAILAITDISGNNFPNETSEKRFFEIIHAGFAHKRKLLAGNLKELFGEKTRDILRNAGIKENARAENITLNQWLALARTPTSR